MSTLDIITLCANIALTLSFIIALIFGVAQVKAAERDRRERFTLDTLRRFHTREFAELIYYVSSTDMPSTTAEWRKRPEEDRITFIQFTQEMESLGILVAQQFVNMDLIDITLGSFVVTSWEKFKALVVDLRVEVSDPFLCEYFQWLAEHVDQRMKLYPRKPYHETAK